MKMYALPIVLRRNAILLFIQLRPRQWTKNLLVFAAFVFSINKADFSMFIIEVVTFFLFCFVSSSVYIVNDFVDREADSKHPEKKHRPMASGMLNPYLALSFGSFLLIASLIVSYLINIPLFSILLAYFLSNVLYSFWLKHVVIIDVMLIASGFVLRAIGGGVAINVSLTPWFLLCTMLLALFLAINKRRHEFILLQKDMGSHRKVLEFYSIDLLEHMNTVVTSTLIMSYSLFTFTSGHTLHLMWTIPLVIYGVFRYLYLVHIKGDGGSPDRVLLEDKPILVTVVLYVFLTMMILYYLE